VTDWMIQLRLTVDETMLEEMQTRLRECVADVDSRPRFLTAQSWYVTATEQLKRLPAPLPVQRAPESEHRGTTKRRRLGAGPQS
jgi:hypothetical protein